MTGYEIAKLVHISCVAVSIAGFVVRFALSVRQVSRQHGWALRVAPHVNDTLLLAAGVTMLSLARIDPFALDWLVAKFVALIVYIGAGMLALRRTRALRVRAIAFAAALLAFGYMLAVALTKHPAPLRAWYTP